jgi:hypothetical protein
MIFPQVECRDDLKSLEMNGEMLAILANVQKMVFWD